LTLGYVPVFVTLPFVDGLFYLYLVCLPFKCDGGMKCRQMQKDSCYPTGWARAYGVPGVQSTYTMKGPTSFT
jgi:hypothetical protein